MKRIRSLSLRNSQYGDQEADSIGEIHVGYSGKTDEDIINLVFELGVSENHRAKWHVSTALEPERQSFKWRRCARNGTDNLP